MKLCYAVIRSRNNSPTNCNENDLLLLKTKKGALILDKKALIVLESSIQNVVLRVCRRKVYRSALFPQNLPCPENVLVALLVRTVYSGIFWPIQGHLETFSHVQTY